MPISVITGKKQVKQPLPYYLPVEDVRSRVDHLTPVLKNIAALTIPVDALLDLSITPNPEMYIKDKGNYKRA